MRNLLNIELSNINQNGVLNAAKANEVILLIHPLSSQKSGLKLTGTASGGASVTSDDLTVENDLITFVVPLEWYSAVGDLVLVLESNEGNSDSFTITNACTVAVTEDDNIKVRWTTGTFVISKIKKIGETLLWENPSPSSSFTAKNVTLKEPAKDYDRLRIEYRAFSSTADEKQGAVELDMDDAWKYTATTDHPYIGLSGRGSSYGYSRSGYFTNTTLYNVIHFNACYRLNGENTSNNYCVPTKIYGINGSAASNQGDILPYQGQYEVTPQPDDAVILETASKYMLGDVTVQKIPYFETSNTSGTTIYIGGNEEI